MFILFLFANSCYNIMLADNSAYLKTVFFKRLKFDKNLNITEY